MKTLNVIKAVDTQSETSEINHRLTSSQMVWAKKTKRNTKFLLINCNSSKSLQITIRFFFLFLKINISLLEVLWKCQAQNLNSFYSNGNKIILIPEEKLIKFPFSSYRGYRNTDRHINRHMKKLCLKMIFLQFSDSF